MPEIYEHFSQQLSSREALGRLRSLKNITPGPAGTILVNRKPLINFGSNDYLCLSSHGLLKQRSIEYIQRYGVGSSASRLITGNLEPYDYIERKLASLKNTETALILPTGYQTNLTVLAALLQSGSFAALDRLSHNSLLSGVQLSEARWSRHKHNDAARAEQAITEAAARYQNRWIITESVFSMDGDRSDLERLAAIAIKTGSNLYVDEAHAMGILGNGGMGLAPGINGVTIAMGTFSKACGSFGAYVACSNQLRDYLLNFCGGLIYSTALPPAVLGAIDAALDIIPTMEKQRQHLLSAADYLRSKLQALGFDTLASSTQIIPVVVGTEEHAVSLSQHLEDGGIFAPAIRPPTVPEGAARIRFSLTLNHTREHLHKIVTLMRNWNAR